MIGPLEALHGNRAAREMLSRLATRGTLPHALCFAGPEGVGKRTMALGIACALQCLESAAADCTCQACHKIEEGIHPDVRTIAADGPIFKIDQVRHVLAMARLKPYEGHVKVFLLDDADRMNEEAANALLKTLEEPPPGTYLVLLTSRPDALLPTIRSRCRMVRFQALPRAEVAGILRERGMEAHEAERRALHAGGSVGLALALDLEATEARRERVLSMLKAMPDFPPASELWAMARAESTDKDELLAVLATWRELARDMAILAHGGAPATLHHPDRESELVALSALVGREGTLKLFREACVTEEALLHNAPRTLAAEVLLLQARSASRP